MQLAIYNLLPGGLSKSQEMAAANNTLPAGTRLAIIEPYFKRTMDGGVSIRVDDPAEASASCCRAARCCTAAFANGAACSTSVFMCGCQ
jgi:hypothetical protein